MITIHKYQFNLSPDFEIEMPEKSKVLDVQLQDGIPTMWVIVNTDWKKEKRKFKAYWTGQELNGLDLFRTHIATIQLAYVWHIFE